MLSLVIITLNEEDFIARCIRSAHFADEVVVVDSGSTDHTVELAEALGARVIAAQDWQGFGRQKNRALDAARGDWILSLDADEWVEPDLAEEIRQVLASADPAEGYAIPRRSRFCGKVVRHCGWSPDYVVRLFRRDCGRFSEAKVHERVLIDGRIVRLRQPLDHTGVTDLADAENKIARYSADGAAELLSRGRGVTRFSAAQHGAGAFLKTYLLQLGFLDGATGWRVASYNARYAYRKWRAVYRGRERA
jgi:glycosyltransferase involved in cell wall biosynthesis